MTPAQAAELLAVAAAFDRRTIGEMDARVWAKALDGLNPADCADAIANHYSRSTDWLMPGHVRAEVRRIRDDRLRSVPSSALEPADVDPNDLEAYQAARLDLIRRIADGEPVPERPALPAHDPTELLADAATSMRRSALRPSPGYLAASRALAAKQRAEDAGVAS